jgi:hypothetical protein
MKFSFKISLSIIILLSISRFIPHPPNFTSLLALSFYVPAIFGVKYIIILILSFALTDLIIGFHNTVLFTWGSVVLIGILSRLFFDSLEKRILGSLIGALIFFIITNFGVWTLGSYGYTFDGLIICYTLALPFFAYSLISTLFFSAIFEFIYKFISSKSKIV